MTAEKANLAKKIPSSTKKKVLFSTSRIPLADGALCVTFSATPSWQKSHLLAPCRCVKFEREKKLYFFFVEEIVFFPLPRVRKIWQRKYIFSNLTLLFSILQLTKHANS
jgi:hypothetical protein